MRLNVIFFLFLLGLHAAIYPFGALPSLTWFGNLVQAIAILLAAIQFGRVAEKSARNEERTFNFIALGFIIWLMGQALLAYSELLLNKPATATVTDAIWLIGYALIARSLFLLTGKGLTRSRKIRLHSRLLALACAIVCIALWRPLIDPERDLPTKFVQVFFPFLDFWISAMAFVLVKRTGTKGWVAAGFGSFIIGVTDLVFPYFYQSISPVYRYLDIPLFVGYSMWWLAGAHILATRKPLTRP